MGGGIGNQLFMYAASRALSLEKGAKLCLDIGDFMIDRDYGRIWTIGDHFSIRYDGIINPKNRITRKIIRAMSHGAGRIHTPLFKSYSERAPRCYDESLARQNHRVIELVGNWQSESYFFNYRDRILNDLQFKIHVPKSTQDTLERIRSHGSAVCLHIRTYCDISGPSELKNIDHSYIERAMRMVSEHDSDAQFFIFADSFERISIPDAYSKRCCCVDVHAKLGNQGGLWDLLLMAYCKHFIVANSSFSWWACYLSQNNWGRFHDSNRIAIFPAKNTLNRDFTPEFGISL
jgi:hypothetical protein